VASLVADAIITDRALVQVPPGGVKVDGAATWVLAVFRLPFSTD